MATAYPLEWPAGIPRTEQAKRTSYSYFRDDVSFDRARKNLMVELGRLGAKNIVLSTNVPLRNDGNPRADAARRRIDDPGIAVYFTYKDKQVAMARDAFISITENIRSLQMAIDALRKLKRHGGDLMLEKSFEGFEALPAPGSVTPQRPWWRVLQYESMEQAMKAGLTLVEDRFRYEAKKKHPDKGGTAEQMIELNHAWEQAQRAFGK